MIQKLRHRFGYCGGYVPKMAGDTPIFSTNCSYCAAFDFPEGWFKP